MPTAAAEAASDVIDEFRKMEPARFFKLAADHGIILSPENFATYLFGDRIKEAAINGIREYLPSIFSTLEKDGGDILNNEKYEPALSFLDDKIEKQAVAKITVSHSLFPAYNSYRIFNDEVVKTASGPNDDPQFSKELAKQYIAYKLAALNHLDTINKLTDDVLFNAVLQNYE